MVWVRPRSRTRLRGCGEGRHSSDAREDVHPFEGPRLGHCFGLPFNLLLRAAAAILCCCCSVLLLLLLQFDTLPMRVGSVAELEPGDLIFYSGAPFDTSARRYPFQMTHVEVFVGGETGEATIGVCARCLSGPASAG